MRLDDAIQRFLLQLHADGRSSFTSQQYARHLAVLARAWGPDAPVEAVTPERLAALLASPAVTRRRDGRAKKATATNTMRSAVRVFFGFLVRAGVLATDPSRLVRRARCATAPPRPLTPDESASLLGALAEAKDPAGRRDFALFHTMLATGIRLGSAVALDVGDVDLAAAEILVRCVKGGEPIRVVLPPGLQEHLAGFTRGREHGPLFAGAGGSALTPRQVQRRLGRWLLAAGILAPASPHTLRHTFATRLYEATGDLLLVKEALGHRSVSSTLVYARADRNRLRDAVSAVAPKLGPGIEGAVGPELGRGLGATS